MDSKTEVTIDAAAKNNLAAAQFAETNAKLINAGLSGGDVGKFFSEDRPSANAIEIPSTINRIGSYAMYGYRNVQFIEIPSNIKEIGFCAFGGCSSLLELYIGHNINKICRLAFEGNRFNSIYIDGADVIERGALSDGGADSTGESLSMNIYNLGRMEDNPGTYLYASNVSGNINIRPGGYLGNRCLPVSRIDGQTYTIDFYISVGEGATIGKEAFANVSPSTDSFITFDNLIMEQVKSYPNYPFGMVPGQMFTDMNGIEWTV